MNASSPLSTRHIEQTVVPAFDTLSRAIEELSKSWSLEDVSETNLKRLESEAANSGIDPQVYRLICSLLPALRDRQNVPKPCEKIALSPWQERRAKDMMASHMDRGLSIAQIAAECSLSRSHFSRAFKKNTGYSPRDWFLQVRMGKAKTLLTETRVSISRISLDCGFADQSHFTRVFTRVTGQTPFNWRRALSTEAAQVG